MKVLRISHSAVVDAWREREREMRRAGVEVLLLSARAWDGGGSVVPLRPRPAEPVVGVRTLGSHPALFVYDPRPIWRALRSDWDVVDVHEEPFALATAEVLALLALRRLLYRRPVPYVLYSAQNIEKRYPWPFRAFERRSLQGSAAVSVCNREAGRIVRAKGARGLVEVIPLGVDLETFRPDATRPEAAHSAARMPAPGRTQTRPSDVVRVGYVGRLASHKGVHVLLEAVASDPALTLDIAGDGPERATLVGQAAELGTRVRFRGAINDAVELAAFYRSLDVLAVPSLETPRWVEQFGRVAVEAMACGVPVVASSTGALPDVVGDAGVLAPANDSAALREALLRVGTRHDVAHEMREAGFARARECSWPRVASRYVDMYRRIRPTSPRDSAERLAGPEVIVVAYGEPELVRAALAPLAGGFPIVVVDNSSMPEIREVAEALGAIYLDPGRNGGFAAGVNHGLGHRTSPERDVLLLNPDAVVTPEDVRRLHRVLLSNDRIASVGPRQVDGDGVPARVAWCFPSPLGTWLEAVGLARLRRPTNRNRFVIGSVLLVNRDALEEVGAFDERFFLYAEETDWAYRATRRGWRHVIAQDAQAIHLGGATSTDPVRRETYFHASQERYLRKHFGAAGWQVSRLGQLLGSLARTALFNGQRRAGAARRAHIYAIGPVRAEARLTGTRR